MLVNDKGVSLDLFTDAFPIDLKILRRMTE
jgi:hypothetical protein